MTFSTPTGSDAILTLNWAAYPHMCTPLEFDCPTLDVPRLQVALDRCVIAFTSTPFGRLFNLGRLPAGVMREARAIRSAPTTEADPLSNNSEVLGEVRAGHSDTKVLDTDHWPLFGRARRAYVAFEVSSVA